MRYILLSCWIFFAFINSSTLKSTDKFRLRIDEPSDIALSSDGSSFYIVSDKGFLYQTNLEGKILRKSPIIGTDFEGVYALNNKVYVVDERYRKIYILNETNLMQEGVLTIPYAGGRNSAYEGICYNKAKNRFVLAIEKNPVMLYELNENFQLVNEIKFEGCSDISALTYHNGFFWILSEEDHSVFKLDPNDYHVVKKYNINVVGAEGIAFSNNDCMYITSDGMNLLYKYDFKNE